MINCHTGTTSALSTPHKQRSILRDPQGKEEPAIGSVLAIPEELETVILSDKAYAMGFLNF
ncbi:hypothetical protein H8356DRAFT_1739406 [Neocallimastix lanati (nom. inval.)]|nr:hypothetical protein H8356DRAFT_1739406 [Neocallimastix sp. JGI-2020a]